MNFVKKYTTKVKIMYPQIPHIFQIWSVFWDFCEEHSTLNRHWTVRFPSFIQMSVFAQHFIFIFKITKPSCINKYITWHIYNTVKRIKKNAELYALLHFNFSPRNFELININVNAYHHQQDAKSFLLFLNHLSFTWM